jgi:hypothetical protein
VGAPGSTSIKQTRRIIVRILFDLCQPAQPVIDANLTTGIRGVFWHQGESDGSN